jgi:hypothetical protein
METHRPLSSTWVAYTQNSQAALLDGLAAPSPFRQAPKPRYEEFLTLWKDAHPDIPILKQANTE